MFTAYNIFKGVWTVFTFEQHFSFPTVGAKQHPMVEERRLTLKRHPMTMAMAMVEKRKVPI